MALKFYGGQNMVKDSDGGTLKQFYTLNEPNLPDASKRTPTTFRLKLPFIFLECVLMVDEVTSSSP